MVEEEEIDLDTGVRRIIRHDPPTLPKRKYPPRHKKRVDGRTLLRQRLTPYLPPPIVRAMGDVDPLLEPYVGPEASITIASSLLLGLLVWQVMKGIAMLSRGDGKAIVEDDEDPLKQVEDFGDTCILCGPMWSGKTRIFHHLCHGDANLPTVMSLRANVAILPLDDDDAKKPLRVLDFPGHAGLRDPLFVELIQARPLRLVLVVDSTQPLAPAADFLYDLLQHAQDHPLHTETDSKVEILVACHKCDLSSSKNPRRIKISLRTELEKLIQLRSAQATSAVNQDAATTITTTTHWWEGEGESLDLDDLHHVRLHFEATTCSAADGIDKLVRFCKTGDLDG